MKDIETLQSIIDNRSTTVGESKASIRSFIAVLNGRMFNCRDEIEMSFLRRMHKAASDVLQFANEKFPDDNEILPCPES
jgi:hypothetical protein